MTPHSTHLFALRPSYLHCTVHTTDGSPLSVAGQGTLCSNSFHVPDVSHVPDLTMQLMSIGRLLTMTVVSFLTLIFAIFRIIAWVIWLVLAPNAMTHSVFGSLTGFVFLPLRPSLLPILLSLLRPRRSFLSGNIV
jgi:hypothetical protein